MQGTDKAQAKVYACSPQTRYWNSEQPLALELGGELASFTLAYRTWGQLSEDGGNAIVVCHALTGSADADQWWPALFGAAGALDPSRDFIICSNVLGGCYGSTGPASTGPRGLRWGKDFPALTIRDQVRAQMKLADALGVRGIEMVIGGSMGGLLALEWALLDADRVRSVAVIAASARHSAWCRSWNEAQRLAIQADPVFAQGGYPAGVQPAAGLGAARAIAMTTYRSPAALEQRYGLLDGPDPARQAPVGDHLGVGDWLRHHAESFAARFDANCYLALLGAMDRHDVGRGRGGVANALRGIAQHALVVSIASDALYLPEEQQEICNHIPGCEFVELPSAYGHDGFLIDAAMLAPHVGGFLGRLRRAGGALRKYASGWEAA